MLPSLQNYNSNELKAEIKRRRVRLGRKRGSTDLEPASNPNHSEARWKGRSPGSVFSISSAKMNEMSTALKYLPTERLGVGPTCDVLLGRDVGGLNRRVAIKQLREEVRNHASRRERFFAAAERWSQFKHDGLVTLYDLDRTEGAIIYEPHPLSGKQAVASGGKGLEHALPLLTALAEAVGHIHDQSCLHLNIKPTNVLFDESGRPKLIDGLCYDREFLGEPMLPSYEQRYFAPEMLTSTLGRIGTPSDLYGLGLTVLEICLGSDFGDSLHVAYANPDAAGAQRSNWLELLDQFLARFDSHPSAVPGIRSIFQRLLLQDPSERYQTGGELLEELKKLRNGGSTVHHSQASDSAPDLHKESEEPQIGDIPARPTIGKHAAPVVLRFLGCDAEMVGINQDSFTMGDSANCDVRFPAALYRNGQTVFRLGRAAEGWRLNCPSGAAYYVNQKLINFSTSLRSGDIIRMAPGGPGIQFTVVNQNAEPLSKLAARYALRLGNSDSPHEGSQESVSTDKSRSKSSSSSRGDELKDDKIDALGKSQRNSPRARPVDWLQPALFLGLGLIALVIIALFIQTWLGDVFPVPENNQPEIPEAQLEPLLPQMNAAEPTDAHAGE